MRMDNTYFELPNLAYPYRFRTALNPCKKMCVTLRFLAMGFVATSVQGLRKIISETCMTNHNVLKKIVQGHHKHLCGYLQLRNQLHGAKT
jgi:dissimilatory sulfite reductase (desulfoviridin) alpha/beta subunit